MIERLLLVDVDYRYVGDAEETSVYFCQHPVGLLQLAAMVQQHCPAIDVRIFHTATQAHPGQALAELVDTYAPQLIGLRSLSIYREHQAALSAQIRQAHPAIPIIAGGPCATASWREMLCAGEADLCVLGEGDVTLVELLKVLQRTGKLPTDLAGTAIRQGDAVIRNADRPFIADLDSLPFPAYDHIDLAAYRHLHTIIGQPLNEIAVVAASRGCPFHCMYCHQMFGKQVRRYSPAYVVQQMEHLHHTKGVNEFAFIDDVFNVPLAHAKSVLRLIAQRLPGIRLAFYNGLRADHLDAEAIELFEAAGTYFIALAIETASPRLQRLIGKNLNLDRAIPMIDLVSRRMLTSTCFMVGFPTETWEEALSTLRCAAGLQHQANAMLNIVRVFPHSPLAAFLEPTPEQADGLAQLSMRSRYIARGQAHELSFYGDLFPRDKVPLTSREVNLLSLMWAKDVTLNPVRLRNSTALMRKWLTPERSRCMLERCLVNPVVVDRIYREYFAQDL